MNNILTEDTLSIIKHYESLNDNDSKLIGLQPKMDPNGIWTAGYGRALINPLTKKFLRGNADKQTAYQIGTLKDEAQALEWLMEDVQPFVDEVNRIIKVPISDYSFGSLVSLAYNCGIGALTKTIVPAINGNNNKLATDTILKYYFGEGGKLPGLYARRLTEVDFFFTGKIVYYSVDKNFNAKAIV